MTWTGPRRRVRLRRWLAAALSAAVLAPGAWLVADGLVVPGLLGASAPVAAIVLGPAGVAAAAPAAAARPAVLVGTRRELVAIRVGRLSRVFVDVAPSNRGRPATALPLVLVLHGREQTPWRAERIQGWDRLAASGRAVVAYGAGYAGSWNAGTCCGRAARAGVDDVGYLLQVIRSEVGRHRIDRRRVYLVGFSNGGMLAYRFACAHAELLSAVAVVDGSLQVRTCRPSRALDVLAVQGNLDRVVPYAGSRFSPVAGAATTSILSSLPPWQRLAGRGAVVRLVRLPGLGHVWPTRQRGRWDATEQIWRFFNRHRGASVVAAALP